MTDEELGRLVRHVLEIPSKNQSMQIKFWEMGYASPFYDEVFWRLFVVTRNISTVDDWATKLKETYGGQDA